MSFDPDPYALEPSEVYCECQVPGCGGWYSVAESRGQALDRAVEHIQRAAHQHHGLLIVLDPRDQTCLIGVPT